MARAASSSSMEDYLEAIYAVIQEKQAVRSKEIAGRLGVRAASVTGALRQLSAKGLVCYEPYGEITLTAGGEALARDVVERHRLLHDFFFGVLGLSEAEADPAACRVEHALTPELRERLAAFVRFLDACPGEGQGKWRANFRYFLKNGRLPRSCSRCPGGAGGA